MIYYFSMNHGDRGRLDVLVQSDSDQEIDSQILEEADMIIPLDESSLPTFLYSTYNRPVPCDDEGQMLLVSQERLKHWVQADEVGRAEFVWEPLASPLGRTKTKFEQMSGFTRQKAQEMVVMFFPQQLQWKMSRLNSEMIEIDTAWAESIVNHVRLGHRADFVRYVEETITTALKDFMGEEKVLEKYKFSSRDATTVKQINSAMNQYDEEQRQAGRPTIIERLRASFELERL